MDKDKTGVLAGLIGAFLGPSIPIPGGTKYLLAYRRTSVDPDAVQVGAVIAGQVPRTPSLTIEGDSAITFHSENDRVSREYQVATLDDVLPPVTFAWTVNQQPAGDGPLVTTEFAAGNPGQVDFHAIAVTATDQDGLAAHAWLTVRVETPTAQSHHTAGGDGPSMHER